MERAFVTIHRPEPIDRAIYERASRLRPDVRSQLLDGEIRPDALRWLDDGRFAYTTTANGERRHRLIDPAARTRTEISSAAFGMLPFWMSPQVRGAIAPHHAHELVARDNNLWLRAIDDGTEIQLTTDGEDDACYGTDVQAGNGNTSARHARPIIARWSPDGRYAITQRTIARGVRRVPMIESSPADGGKPRVEFYIESHPGDEHVPLADVFIVDTQKKTIRAVEIPSLVLTHSSPLLRHDLWWDAAGKTIYALHSSRDWRTLTLYAIDPATGTSRELLTERDTTRVRPSQQFHQVPNVRIVADDNGDTREIIWYSLRDGWGHLYLHDATSGELIRQLTSGECGVEEILRVDAAMRTIWVSMSGLVAEDPYRRTTVAVDLDRATMTLLDEDGLDHRVLVPPTAASALGYLDSASTVDTPPVVTFRNWAGEVLVELEHVDVTRLEAIGWQRPQRFVATGADGVTPIYGTLFLPPDFDPSRSYPVVDQVYPGPQVHRSEPFFTADDAEPLAALGMIGVTIDGRGTPGRCRAFHNASWRNLGAGSGLEDHVAALRELAETRPWLDLTRVGVVGHSAGGYAVTRAMELFPDFFTVGVAQSGRHDGRLTMAMILEAYDGPPDAESYARASAVEPAGDITGKLLLIHGELDRGVSLSQSLRVIDRMIAANRDVDLIVIPGDDHIYSKHLHYVERRTWDYLVRHLLGEEPPHEFAIADVAITA